MTGDGGRIDWGLAHILNPFCNVKSDIPIGLRDILECLLVLGIVGPTAAISYVFCGSSSFRSKGGGLALLAFHVLEF